MRWFLAALLAAATVAPAAAQTAPSGVLTPAPVPGIDRSIGPPADRAGRPDGSERGAPFSGLPSSLTPGSGEQTPATLGTTDRPTAPAPGLSR